MDKVMHASDDNSVYQMLASLEQSLLPDAEIRRLLRVLLTSRLRSGYKSNPELQLSDLLNFVKLVKEMPIAIKTEEAKAIVYEVPTSFFKLILGKHLKFSCCLFDDKSKSLEQAEESMLELYCERAKLKDGHSVLDIGCGWGSLSLYIAKKYTNCKVTGICNSMTQKQHIDEQCRDLGLKNVEIMSADICTHEMKASYDRIFSIEMFEHMSNYMDLLKKISMWMKPNALLFIEYFCHKVFAYHCEPVNEDDWLTRYFFSGFTVASSNLLLYFQDDVSVVDHWIVNGTHFAKSSEEWLTRMDQKMSSIKPIMEVVYGMNFVIKWTIYWRTLFIWLAEMFAYNEGQEWMISQFLFKKK